MKHSKSRIWALVMSLALLLLATAPTQAAQAIYPEIMFILDASGSMWGKAGGQFKIDAAKQVMKKILPALPKEVKYGLTTYGHRKKGDCKDVQVIIPVGGSNRQAFLIKIAALSPKGKTPIAHSVQMVAERLKQKENETTIVLISDGVETCHDDPCGVVKSLKKSGLKFVLHVVGFDVDQKGKKQLTCLAKEGGGQYFSAGDAASLLAALESVKKEVVQKVEKAKTSRIKSTSRLGKLEIKVAPKALVSLAGLKIIRLKDNKEIKNSKKVPGTHPLLSGKYRVVLSFANSNYKPPTDAALADVEIKGGQTTTLNLGTVLINLAKGLEKTIWRVGLEDAQGKTYVRIQSNNNAYYLFKPKPAPAGEYRLTFTYGRSKTPVVAASGINVSPGKDSVVTLDTGFALKKNNAGVQRWQLMLSGEQKPYLDIERRWDNDFPLWYSFPVPPGSYDLYVFLKGMKEAMPVGEGIEIKKGQTVVFDAGL
jgi:Mg-chelatase subunit ChlD